MWIKIVKTQLDREGRGIGIDLAVNGVHLFISAKTQTTV